MRGFPVGRANAAGKKFANGGPVRGPGNGTSDDVADEVPEGTYIMPADSTAAVGEQALGQLGQKQVPVQLSNGEYKLPPEQVHAVGVQALDQMKGATHTPQTARGFAPALRHLPDGEPRQFFAGGGVVLDDENASRFAKVPDSIGHQPGRAPAQAPATGPQPTTDRGLPGFVAPAPAESVGAATKSPSGIYMEDRTQEMKSQLGQGNYAQAAGTAARTAVQGLGMYGLEAADKIGSPVVSAARGFGVGLFGTDAQAATPPNKPAPRPAPAAAPVSPPAPAGPIVGHGRGAVNPPAVNPATPAPTSSTPGATEIAPGVFRSGSSYGDSAQAAVAGPQTRGLPSADNLAAAEALSRNYENSVLAAAPRGLPMPAGVPSMPTPGVRHSGNDWESAKRQAPARTGGRCQEHYQPASLGWPSG